MSTQPTDISGLPPLAEVSDADLIPIVDAGVTKRTPAAAFLAYVKYGLGTSALLNVGSGANEIVQRDPNGDIVGPIIMKYDTAANLATVTLDAGQFAYAYDQGFLYVGDGTHSCATLINSLVATSNPNSTTTNRGWVVGHSALTGVQSDRNSGVAQGGGNIYQTAALPGTVTFPFLEPDPNMHAGLMCIAPGSVTYLIASSAVTADGAIGVSQLSLGMDQNVANGYTESLLFLMSNTALVGIVQGGVVRVQLMNSPGAALELINGYALSLVDATGNNNQTTTPWIASNILQPDIGTPCYDLKTLSAALTVAVPNADSGGGGIIVRHGQIMSFHFNTTGTPSGNTIAFSTSAGGFKFPTVNGVNTATALSTAAASASKHVSVQFRYDASTGAGYWMCESVSYI